MAKLTYKQRKRLPASAFALDGLQRRYPLNDIEHARNALARVSAFGTPEEKRIVRQAVYRRYPELKPVLIRGRSSVITPRTPRISPKTPRIR